MYILQRAYIVGTREVRVGNDYSYSSVEHLVFCMSL